MVRLGCWLLLLGLCACEGMGGPDLGWSVRFANPDTAARASRVDVSIVAGSCTSQDVVYSSSVTRDVEARVPPNLANGSYSLLGRAFSVDCTLIAAGCAELRLPAAGKSVEVVLDDVRERAPCTGACDAKCGIGLDGGTGGSVEAGTPEAGDPGLHCDALEGPNGRCYRLERKTKTFADAEAACVTWGGHLVSFNDGAEELWVTQQAAVLAVGGIPPNFWIGFTDRLTEAQWVWTDGSTAPSTVITFTNDVGKIQYKTASDTPYTHWGPNAQTGGNGQPNNGTGGKDSPPPEGQDCAASMGSKLSGPGGITPRPGWDDVSCLDLKLSACERP